MRVIDFAKNYAHFSQNEPQSAHWNRRQTTTHPICINFRCTEENCNQIVTLEMVCFTEDLKHDPYAVKTFEEAAENYLRRIGISMTAIFQWSDNCINQYKSKYTFDILSESVTPKMWNYYGEKHGKSAADRIIGRLKMKIDQEIRSGTVTLDTTDELYNYCVNKLETQPTVGCQHYRRHYILIKEILDQKRQSNHPLLQKSLKIHSVRPTGIPGVIEKQELSCMCDICLEGGEKCQNCQLEIIVNGIKKKYKSLRNAHKHVKHDLNWKRFHIICNPKKEFHLVQRILTKKLNEVIELYNHPSVTMTIPFKRHAKKQFMIISISEAYQKYIMMKKLSRSRILSMSSFYKLKPKNVKTKKMIPFNVCTCDTCTNYSLDRDALIEMVLKAFPGKQLRQLVQQCAH